MISTTVNIDTAEFSHEYDITPIRSYTEIRIFSSVYTVDHSNPKLSILLLLLLSLTKLFEIIERTRHSPLFLHTLLQKRIVACALCHLCVALSIMIFLT